MSERGTPAAQWDKDTWAPLEDLARNKPEAGVHFQGVLSANARSLLVSANDKTECEIYNRTADAKSATAAWFSELLSPNAWFKDVVPNVSCHFTHNPRECTDL